MEKKKKEVSSTCWPQAKLPEMNDREASVTYIRAINLSETTRFVPPPEIRMGFGLKQTKAPWNVSASNQAGSINADFFSPETSGVRFGMRSTLKIKLPGRKRIAVGDRRRDGRQGRREGGAHDPLRHLRGNL